MPDAGLMSSPPESKHTPLPTIATRGIGRIAPCQLDQARRALARGGAADGVDHRIAFGQRIALHDGEARAAIVGDLLGRGGEFGRAQVGGGRIDEIAHQRDRLGEPHRLVDPRGIGGQQDALRDRLGIAAVAIEAVVGEQPAERGGAGIAIGEADSALGQARRPRRRDPTARLRRARRRRADHSSGLPPGSSANSPGLPREARGGDRGAHALGLAAQPFVEAGCWRTVWSRCAGWPRSGWSSEEKSVIERLVVSVPPV